MTTADRGSAVGSSARSAADKGTDVETFVQDKGLEADGARLTAIENLLDELPSGSWDRAKKQLMPLARDVGTNYAEELVEEAVPYAKMIIIAAKIADAFGGGVRQGIMDARRELDWDGLIASIGTQALTDQDIERIQRIRGYQLENIKKFPDVIKKGIDAAARQAVDLVTEEVASRMLEKVSDSLARSVGDFVGDLMTGDYIRQINLVDQPVEDFIERTVSFHTKLVFVSLAQAVATKAVAAGLEAEVEGAYASNEIPESLRGVLPSARGDLEKLCEFRVALNRLVDSLHRDLVAENERERRELDDLRQKVVREAARRGEIIVGEAYRSDPGYLEGQLKIFRDHEKRIRKIDRSFRREASALAEKWGVAMR